jgi:nitrogenase-stabilizing/protective protein
MNATDKLLATMAGFSAAEEFLDFLGVEYDQAVVDVNRLHILKRFHQYLRSEDIPVENGEMVAKALKTLLERAYQDFVRSNAVTEKVFKVFHQAEGTSHVSAENLRMSLPSRRAKGG